jgi:hypothetical protein
VRTRSLIGLLAVAVVVAGNAAVIAAPGISVFKRSDRGAAAAQYRAPNLNACRAVTNAHERSEDRLAARNRLTRSNRRSADRREIRRARQRGLSQAQIRRLNRRNLAALRALQRKHRGAERALDRRNDAAANRLGCGQSTIDR